MATTVWSVPLDAAMGMVGGAYVIEGGVGTRSWALYSYINEPRSLVLGAPVEDASLAAILASDDVVYACELSAGIRGWAVTNIDETIGAQVIAATMSIVRVATSDAFYIATTAFGTGSDQTPASTLFTGRLGGISFRRSIANGSNFSGVATGDGELEINNADAKYDTRSGQVIAGRDIVVKVGRLGIPYNSWSTIFKGTAREWSFDEQSIKIAIRDDSYRLEVPVQTTLFLGTGAAEGGDELKDKRKPLVLGYVINVAPPQLNTDLVYQVNDGALNSVFAVRDRGSALTFGSNRASYAALVAATIAPGNYDTCLVEGYIRLGASPAGTVTVDAATYRASGKSTISAICKGTIDDNTVITNFDDAAFTALAALYPNDAGVYLDENDNSSVADALSRLLSGVTGYVTFTRTGQCTVGILVAPDVPADAFFGMSDILAISYERLPSLLSPPPWRLRISYKHNYTVQSDLSGAADPTWAQPDSVASASDANVQLDNPLAQDPEPIESFIVSKADADIEVLRQFTIYSIERPLRRVQLPRRAMPLEIGQVIDLDYDRLGGRRLGVIIEDDINVPPGDSELDTVEVLLYG